MAYPFKKYKYRVEIEGMEQAGFSEVSGFDATVDVIEYRQGDDQVNSSVKLPGLTKYGNVTLKWGMSESTQFYEWVINTSNGQIERKTVTIILLDDEGNDKATWQMINAWPTKYSAPDFNASSSEVAFESIEIVHEGMTRTM